MGCVKPLRGGKGSERMTNEAVGPDSGTAGPWRFRLGLVLAVASFAIYAAIVFSLPQVKSGPYCCEQSSFASAVSDVAFGARVGSLYSGLFHYFIDHSQE